MVACCPHASAQQLLTDTASEINCDPVPQLAPHADEDITVEQYFEAECHRLIQRIKVSGSLGFNLHTRHVPL